MHFTAVVGSSISMADWSGGQSHSSAKLDRKAVPASTGLQPGQILLHSFPAQDNDFLVDRLKANCQHCFRVFGLGTKKTTKTAYVPPELAKVILLDCLRSFFLP